MNGKLAPHSRLTRRTALRLGSLGALGMNLAAWHRLQAAAPGGAARAKSCILLWLDGGPSHLESFDLKPQAPEEVRGPLRPIATDTAGIQISECLEQLARLTKHFALIRSMTSPLGEHGLANHYLLTGHRPSPVLDYPSYGAVLARHGGGTGALPPYVVTPSAGKAMGSGYLGPSCAPFVTRGDPAKPDFQVQDLEFFPGVSAERVERRRAYVLQLDRFQRQWEEQPELPADSSLEQAFRLVVSPEAKAAFDLRAEPAKVRQRYGPRTLGQCCLLARRLIERGVRLVTVNYPGWDTHERLYMRLKEGYTGASVGVGLLPTLDLALSGLLADLAERRLLDETLVVVMGEFGRTPKLNSAGGRDHWPRVFSALLAGGGIRGGQVIGSSDRSGESPRDRPVTPPELAATIYTLLGIDPAGYLTSLDGRPIPVTDQGQVIRELIP